MRPRVRDVTSASLLTGSALGSAALAFAVQAALARSLSPVEYGRYAAALAIVTIIAPAVGFGVPSFWLKAYGAEGWAAKRWIEPSLRVVARSGLVCLIAAVLWAWIGTSEAGVSQLLLWMLPVILTQGAIEMASAKLQLEEKFARVAIWQTVQHAARLAVILTCWEFGWGSREIALGFGLIGAVVTLRAWRSIATLRNGKAQLVGHGQKSWHSRANPLTPSTAELWRNAMPFGVSSVLFYAYAQSGVVIVSHFGSLQDVGVYGVAVTILSALYLLPTVLFQKLLMPRFHRWSAAGDDRLARVFGVGSKWIFALGVLFAALAALLAPVAIPLVFGAQYEQSVNVVMLMMLSTPFRFLTVSASSVMTTGDLIRVRNRCAAAALLFSVTAVMTGIYYAGIVGAALASVMGEIMWAVLSVLCARSFLANSPRKLVLPDTAMQRANDRHHLVPELVDVSAVIPCFNCIDTIERAVESVFLQTYRPKELIVVDDCSTDGTHRLLCELARTYPSGWIRVVLQPCNAGPGTARNAAWAIATQPYIAFLDSDDSWHPEKLAIQYRWMRDNPDVAITGHAVAQLEAGDDPAMHAWQAFGAPQRMSRRRILFSNRFTPSSILVRADIRARFDETKRYAEDYFMLLELILKNEGQAFLFPLSLSYIYKAQFGAQSGLSSQLWKIQKGEQDNYLFFRKSGAISYIEWASFSLLSACKYLRRCALSRRFT